MEISAIPLPLSKKGKVMIGLLILGLIAIWVLDLCLEEMEPEIKQNLPQFVGIQQVEVSW